MSDSSETGGLGADLAQRLAVRRAERDAVDAGAATSRRTADDGWRREVARLQAELRNTEAERGEAILALAAAQKENRDLRGLIAQIAATAMVGAKA
jgi:hypothetical protein